jgi:hypothetical protein
MTKHPIKLLKLSNGESVVCRVDADESKAYTTLIEPIKIHKWMSPSEDGDGAYENATFGPWESFSAEQIFHVANNQIITLTEPREDVIVYYNRVVDKLKTTPVASLTEDEDPMMRMRKLRDIVEDLNEQLGLGESETTEEDVAEYMYNKDNITKH